MSSLRRLTLFVTCVVALSAFVPAEAGAATTAPARRDCYSEIARYWPRHLQPWARRIVWRESRNTPSAANGTSSARGCFQMLLRFSAPFYRAVGCSNYMWANPTCNVRAAYVLYRRAGASPWRI